MIFAEIDLEYVAEVRRRVGGANAAIDAGVNRLEAIRDGLMRSTADSRLDDDAFAMERRLRGFQDRPMGVAQRGRFGDPGPISVSRRIESRNLPSNSGNSSGSGIRRDTSRS